MNKSLLTLGIFLAIFLTGCGTPIKANRTDTVKQPTIDLSQQTPIIFLHGSGGSENDLASFADNITDSQPKEVSRLQVTINSDNQLTYLNQLNDKDQLPLIFVGFENSDALIEEWSLGLASLLKDLNKHYQFQTVDLVGFSNGGLAAGYLAESHSEFKALPELNKLVMIGAPFNDLEPLNDSNPLNFGDLSNQDAYFDKFLQKKEQLSSTLAVLAIAGDVGDPSFSDGVVPISSALGSRLIFPDYVQTYQERLSYGELASHVGLVSGNQEVVDWVQHFLFDSTKTSPTELVTSPTELVTSLKKR